jgi:hypothetical protein
MTRAAVCTARPLTDSPLISHSPMWMPVRVWRPSERTASRMAHAQRSPAAGRSNVAKKLSPAVSISRPPARESSRRTAAR